MKQEIVIVWFKRDLRFTDHEPLYVAQKQSRPVLLIYCFEPSVMHYDDSNVRHWRFIYQSLQEMQEKLLDFNSQVYVFHAEVFTVLQKLAEHYDIKNIFSHQEIGNKITYDRDIVIHQFCLNNNIEWKEYQHNGVVRKLKSRKVWDQLWKQKMEETPKLVDEENWNFLKLNDRMYSLLKGPDLNVEITSGNKAFQPGGESNAWK